MKAFLIALLMSAAGLANSEVIMTANNGGGGKIELTDTPAPVTQDFPICNDRLLAKTWGSGPDQMGCWLPIKSSNTVTIYWVAADEHRTYSIDIFTATDYLKAMYR